MFRFSNRLEWADLVEKARVNEFKPQWEALRNGLASVLPISMLTMFTWKELEILATGNPVLDIEKLKVPHSSLFSFLFNRKILHILDILHLAQQSKPFGRCLNPLPPKINPCSCDSLGEEIAFQTI